MDRITRAADALAAGYQRHLSPRTSFSCAHRLAHGGPSCSTAVRAIWARRGVFAGAPATVLRFLACYRAASLLMGTEVRGVCCCGPIPLPFRFGGR